MKPDAMGSKGGTLDIPSVWDEISQDQRCIVLCSAGFEGVEICLLSQPVKWR